MSVCGQRGTDTAAILGPSRPLSDFMSPEQFAKFNAETARLKREMEREMSPVGGAKRS